MPPGGEGPTATEKPNLLPSTGGRSSPPPKQSTTQIICSINQTPVGQGGGGSSEVRCNPLTNR